MERTTKEIEIANATIVLYDFITGRDKRVIEAVYLSQAQISQKGGKDSQGQIEISGVSANINHLMQDAAFKAVIKEILPHGGAPITDRQKVVDFILDLPEAEFARVIAAVNEITDPKKA